MSVARGEFQQTFLKLFYIDDCQLRAIEEGEKKKKKEFSPHSVFVDLVFFVLWKKGWLFRNFISSSTYFFRVYTGRLG